MKTLAILDLDELTAYDEGERSNGAEIKIMQHRKGPMEKGCDGEQLRRNRVHNG